MAPDLMLAILAMDAYNRGYDPGVELEGSSVGAATIRTDSQEVFRDPNAPAGTPTEAEAAGFYAIAYEWNGQAVISYRGTDNPSPLAAASDFWNGWTAGAVGAPAPSSP